MWVEHCRHEMTKFVDLEEPDGMLGNAGKQARAARDRLAAEMLAQAGFDQQPPRALARMVFAAGAIGERDDVQVAAGVGLIQPIPPAHGCAEHAQRGAK